MFYEESQKIILASWIHSEHLEDTKVLPISEFTTPYKEIAEAIKGGSDLIGLQRKFGAKQIADLVTNYAPILYESNLREILKSEMLRTIPGDPTPDDLKRHAERFRRDWYNKPQPADAPTVYLDELHERSMEEHVSTGIALIDDKVGSICKGRLVVVGARPSVGKSAFTLQVAFDVARKGKRVLFLPLEMSAAETVDRLVMRFSSSVTYSDLRRGKLSADQHKEVMAVLDSISQLQNEKRFLIYEGVNEISRIRCLIADLKPDLVVIDQLSQVTTENALKTVRERYVEVTRELKAVALAERTAIWLPVQMNRESSKTGMVSIDYLKESGSIEEDADVVIILSNAKDEQGRFISEPDGRLLDIELAKNRMGACGKEMIKFNAARFKFINLVQEGFEETVENVPF